MCRRGDHINGFKTGLLKQPRRLDILVIGSWDLIGIWALGHWDFHTTPADTIGGFLGFPLFSNPHPP
jgi:hypothetical protein